MHSVAASAHYSPILTHPLLRPLRWYHNNVVHLLDRFPKKGKLGSFLRRITVLAVLPLAYTSFSFVALFGVPFQKKYSRKAIASQNKKKKLAPPLQLKKEEKTKEQDLKVCTHSSPVKLGLQTPLPKKTRTNRVLKTVQKLQKMIQRNQKETPLKRSSVRMTEKEKRRRRRSADRSDLSIIQVAADPTPIRRKELTQKGSAALIPRRMLASPFVQAVMSGNFGVISGRGAAPLEGTKLNFSPVYPRNLEDIFADESSSDESDNEENGINECAAKLSSLTTRLEKGTREIGSIALLFETVSFIADAIGCLQDLCNTDSTVDKQRLLEMSSQPLDKHLTELVELSKSQQALILELCKNYEGEEEEGVLLFISYVLKLQDKVFVYFVRRSEKAVQKGLCDCLQDASLKAKITKELGLRPPTPPRREKKKKK